MRCMWGTPECLCGEITCGSEPARESAVSGNVNIQCADAFASRLAPTGLSTLKMIAQKKWQPRQRLPFFQPARLLAVNVKLEVLVLHLLVLAIGTDFGDSGVEFV